MMEVNYFCDHCNKKLDSPQLIVIRKVTPSDTFPEITPTHLCPECYEKWIDFIKPKSSKEEQE